jgi:hypothetical protein
MKLFVSEYLGSSLRWMNQSQTPIFVEAMCTLLLGIQETLVPSDSLSRS